MLADYAANECLISGVTLSTRSSIIYVSLKMNLMLKDNDPTSSHVNNSLIIKAVLLL